MDFLFHKLIFFSNSCFFGFRYYCASSSQYKGLPSDVVLFCWIPVLVFRERRTVWYHSQCDSLFLEKYSILHRFCRYIFRTITRQTDEKASGYQQKMGNSSVIPFSAYFFNPYAVGYECGEIVLAIIDANVCPGLKRGCRQIANPTTRRP